MTGNHHQTMTPSTSKPTFAEIAVIAAVAWAGTILGFVCLAIRTGGF